MFGKTKELAPKNEWSFKTHLHKSKEQLKKLSLQTASRYRKPTKTQQLLVLGLIALLALGALGTGTNLSGNNLSSILSKIAETVGLKEKQVNNPFDSTNLPDGTLQLSKEYIYAGSRMLAMEDYGVSGTIPTPTPTPSVQSPPLLTPISVTASATYGSDIPANAIDNNLSTSWVANNYAPQWIQLDLGQLSNISKVRLHVNQHAPGQTVHQIYLGSTSDNLVLAGTIDSVTEWGQWLEITLAHNNIRYVRITTTSSPSWIAWNEVQVFGFPSLIPVSVTASNIYEGNVAANAIDNNLSTAWVADDYAPQWIQLDLGQSSNISKVRLHVNQHAMGPTVHQIYFGSTADNLVLVGTLEGVTEWGQWLEIAPAQNNIRYIRITTTTSPSWIAWNEIQVFGVPAP